MSKEIQEKILGNLVSIMEVLQIIDNKINGILKQKPIDFYSTESQNVIAAKIINEIKEKIDKCDCLEKYFGKLKDGEVLTPIKIKEEEEEVEKPKERTTFGLHKYSYPNYDVGNASLGSSGNPHALKWPFGDKK